MTTTQSSNAERQSRHRRGLKAELREIKHDLRDLRADVREVLRHAAHPQIHHSGQQPCRLILTKPSSSANSTR
jgi:hypothetical protein